MYGVGLRDVPRRRIASGPYGNSELPTEEFGARADNWLKPGPPAPLLCPRTSLLYQKKSITLYLPWSSLIQYSTI